MKYLKQFLLILCITFVGELVKYVLPLPIPASIYGMVILFVGLMTGHIKLSSVKEAGKFLIAGDVYSGGRWSDGIVECVKTSFNSCGNYYVC